MHCLSAPVFPQVCFGIEWTRTATDKEKDMCYNVAEGVEVAEEVWMKIPHCILFLHELYS